VSLTPGAATRGCHLENLVAGVKSGVRRKIPDIKKKSTGTVFIDFAPLAQLDRASVYEIHSPFPQQARKQAERLQYKSFSHFSARFQNVVSRRFMLSKGRNYARYFPSHRLTQWLMLNPY